MDDSDLKNVSPSHKKITNTIMTRRKALKVNNQNACSPINKINNLKSASPKPQNYVEYSQKNKKIKTMSVNVQTDCSSVKENACQTEIDLENLVTCNELLGTNWLSDKTINQYIDLLNNLILKNEPMCVMNPLIVQAVKQTPDFSEYLDPIDMNQWNIILMPINDSKCMLSEGGSHWSLLVYNRKKNKFFHYDSIERKNYENATRVAEKIFKYTSGNCENMAVTEVKGPQQENAYDCGIFMLFAIELTISNFLTEKEIVNMSFLRFMNITKKEAIQKRATLAYILNNRCRINYQLLSLFIAFEENGGSTTHVNLNSPSGPAKWTEVKGKNSHMQKNAENTAVECTNRFSCLMETRSNNNHHEPQEDKQITSNTKVGQHFKSSKLKENNRTEQKAGLSKVTIFGDSHAKGCAVNLQKIFNYKEACVSGNVYPGAPLSYVYKEIEEAVLKNNYTKNDVIMIVGGSNSINTEEEGKIELLLNTLLAKINDMTNVVLTTIPHRYDQPYLNPTIHKINSKIYKTAVHHKCSFLPINNLIAREHFTKEGLHLNKKGKEVLCTSIALHATIRLYSKTTTTNTTTVLSSIPLNNKYRSKIDMQHASLDFKGFSTPTQYKMNTFQDFLKKYNEEKPISVVETNMKNAIQDFRSDETVAFAHTISSDLGNKRNMTAGVAVVFKEEFGRPQRTDCISNHLAYQKTSSGASVYSLITKLEYNGKPTNLDYDLAFQHLTKDFKEKGLKRLVCSAMGCVRDMVSPDRLIANLTKFQEATGATVNIMSYNQYSARSLWNGLSHNSFVKKLNYLIAYQHLQNTSPVSSLEQISNSTIPLATNNSSQTPMLAPTVLSSFNPQMSTQTKQKPVVDTNQSFLEDLSLFPPL